MPVDLGQYRLGRRVPYQIREIAEEPTRVFGFDFPSRVFARAASTTTTCVSNSNEDLCEKPSANTGVTLPIVLGVVIPVVGAVCVLLYLHRRNVKRTRQEDQMDTRKSWDFGMTMDQAGAGKPKRKSVFGLGGEKTAGQRQLSIDMNLSSPYLLPPEIHNSRESLSTLARSIHENEDPYRPVTQYATSDVASLRSFRKDGSSIYTRSSFHGAEARHGSLSAPTPNSPRSRSPGFPPPYPEKEMLPYSATMPSAPPAVKDSYAKETSIPELDSVSNAKYDNPVSAVDGALQEVAELQVPAAAATRNSPNGLPASPRPQESVLPKLGNHQSMSEAGDELFIYDKPGLTMPEEPVHDWDQHEEHRTRADSLPSDSHQALRASINAPGQFSFNVTSIPEMPSDEDDELRLAGPQHLEDDRGRPQHRRQSSEYPQDDSVLQSSGLDLPQADTRRLSVGFRPLPPDEVIESEDPETRANRIRSFYKEYFDDSRPDMAEYNQHYPPNGIPAQYRGGPGRGPGGPQFPGDSGAYFDPKSNTFVMPYAQPVSRRAMTPPPSGSRFPGGGRPRVGPGHHGSMGGMSAGMRPGSSASNMRSGSAMGPRPGPRKPVAPPADLLTLPTPSKLKDDGLSLLGAIDFAPPPSMAEHVSGRPQSPLGERRPYQMKVPVSSPLVSSFEEMSALPSPHVLRKSSLFTGLDFAPPRKFKDADTMSDAGSIRSNRSGISPLQQQAIRNGAGRVSRLPEDNVFTQAAMADQLKPSWGMRP